MRSIGWLRFPQGAHAPVALIAVAAGLAGCLAESGPPVLPCRGGMDLLYGHAWWAAMPHPEGTLQGILVVATDGTWVQAAGVAGRGDGPPYFVAGGSASSVRRACEAWGLMATPDATVTVVDHAHGHLDAGALASVLRLLEDEFFLLPTDASVGPGCLDGESALLRATTGRGTHELAYACAPVDDVRAFQADLLAIVLGPDPRDNA